MQEADLQCSCFNFSVNDPRSSEWYEGALLERFSFVVTANAKRQTAGCCLSKKQENYLILAYFSVFSTGSIAVANRKSIS